MERKTSISYSTDFSEFYQEYRHIILNFIAYRIPYKYEAEDLVQDVFIRLWEHWDFVNKATLWSLVYTIARNIITDKIRRYYRQEDFISYIYNNVKETSCNSVEEGVYYRELERMHHRVISLLPAKRRRIYKLSFNDELSCPMIAKAMFLSSRTVEGQLLAARKTVRAYLRSECLKVG